MKLFSLRVLRESGRQKLFFVPFLFTFANAMLGFLAIVNALDGKTIVAAYCIMLATLMDLLDGRIARALGSTSNLGMELDSLCDAVSFCLAPTIVIYSWQLVHMGVFGKAALVFYLCSGLLRLARFNITCSQQTVYFIGLPTPIAALFLASCVINQSALAASLLAKITSGIGMLVLIVFIAYLMMSSIAFPTFKKYKFTRSARYCVVASCCAVIAGYLQGYPMLFIGIAAYIFSSVLVWIYTKKICK